MTKYHTNMTNMIHVDRFQCSHIYSSGTFNYQVNNKLFRQKMQSGSLEKCLYLKYFTTKGNHIKKIFFSQHNKVTEQVVFCPSYFRCVFSFFYPLSIPIDSSHVLTPKIVPSRIKTKINTSHKIRLCNIDQFKMVTLPFLFQVTLDRKKTLSNQIY